MKETNIHDFVKGQIAAFEKPIQIIDGWDWSFKEHVKRSFLYKNSQFEEDNEDRANRPFKNIVQDILNVQYRTEGFDVKDIDLYVNEAENYFKSFLVKKFHENWALEHQIDTFIDEVVESYADYGGVLVKNVNDERPEVVNLSTIAFCNQHHILSRPFGILHLLSPDELKEKEEVRWGDENKGATISLDALITLTQKENDKNDGDLEIFEIHGSFPEHFLGGDSDKYSKQLHIIAYYKNDVGEDVGVTLLKVREPKEVFKYLGRHNVWNRALGRGGIEELFESQVWTNQSEIQIQEMLEHASKIFYKSTDPSFKTRNNLRGAEMAEVFTLQEGRDVAQLDTTPKSLALFNDALDRWEARARLLGGAGEALLGEAPTSGTPFKSLEAQIIEGKDLHRWRQGQIAVFMDEIYRDWVLPHITKEITKGKKFLAELSMEELQTVADSFTSKETFDFMKERILSGELIAPEEQQIFAQQARETFVKGGNKRFMEILKDELKDVPIKVKTSIAGKQKNLALLTDKVVNVVRQFIATPEIRQDREMVKLLNTILESSGLSPIMFGSSSAPTQAQGGGQTEPLKELAASAA